MIRSVLDERYVELPCELNIGGFYCRLWHKGQTTKCHKASACPFKGKCLRYKGEGHVSGDCPLKYHSVEANDVPPAAAADGAGHPADDAEGSAGTLADGDAAAAADPSEGSAGTLADSGSGDVGVPASFLPLVLLGSFWFLVPLSLPRMLLVLLTPSQMLPLI